MSLQLDIKEDIKNAMRAKEALRLEVLRGMSAAFMNEVIAQRRPPQELLSDEDAHTVVKRLVKQRKDSADQFEKGGRPELAQKEKDELVILEKYLPQTMSRDAIREIALAKKAELGVTDKSGMGKFIGAVMKACEGKADGNDVKAVAEELLS